MPMSNEPEAPKSTSGDETGRYLIFFHPEAQAETAIMTMNVAGIETHATSEEAEFATSSEGWRERDTVVVPSLNVAVSSAPPEQINRLETGGRSPIRYIRKEYVFRIASDDQETNVFTVS